MHLVKDENGNFIHHGHEHSYEHVHEHTHADGVKHSHSHSHDAGEGHEHTHENQNETVAILTYMLEHNQHHAEELAQMAEALEQKGMAAAARKIKEGVSNFEKGNADLSEALEFVK